MAKSKFERTKPHVNVGTIGHLKNSISKERCPCVVKVSGASPATGSGLRRRRRPISSVRHLPLAVMMASATFFGASL